MCRARRTRAPTSSATAPSTSGCRCQSGCSPRWAEAMNDIASRVRGIRERIEAACAASGRDPASVTLVAASKSQPIERLRAAWEAGVRTFGENRVQEAESKRPQLRDADWHLLGPLQSNKVRQAGGRFLPS